MAKIGLTTLRYSKLTEAADGTPSYDGAKTPGKAISCNVQITNNSATLYADDTLAEQDTTFQSGTVTVGIDEDDNTTMADLLGHEIDESGEIIRKSTDIAPYVGFGHVATKVVHGAYKYKVEFLYKVKFAEPSNENNTKGESVEFSTTEIEGTIAALKNDKWSIAKTFDTKTAAVTYLEGLMSNTSPVSTTFTVTYNANGGTGTIAATTVTAGQSVTLSDGTGITAPEGKTFSGWATTSTATAANVTSPYTPTADITLYAVWTNA
jgi:phi13 family phage major tail protein